MDNRLGAYIALEAARLVAEAGGAAWDVVAAVAVQEEIGLNGARALAHGLRPDVAIVDRRDPRDRRASGVDPKRINAHPFGSGAVIERGTILNPKVSELLIEVAEAEEIPYTLMASARATGTDADVIHFSRNGVVTGGIGLPLRYMHSAVEMVQLDDVANCAKLLAAFAQRPDRRQRLQPRMTRSARRRRAMMSAATREPVGAQVHAVGLARVEAAPAVARALLEAVVRGEHPAHVDHVHARARRCARRARSPG